MTRSWWRSFRSALRLAPHTIVSVATAHRRVRREAGLGIAEGDIIFRLGFVGRELGPLIGNLGIAGSSLGPYAHIAMVVSLDEQQPMQSLVIEATRFVGVRLLSLGEFVGESVYAGIFRPAVEASVRQAAVEYARAQVGLAYDETFSLDDPLQVEGPAARQPTIAVASSGRPIGPGAWTSPGGGGRSTAASPCASAAASTT